MYICAYTLYVEYHSHLPVLLLSCARRGEGHNTLMAYCSYDPAQPYLKMQHHINLDNFKFIYMCACVHVCI